MKAIYYDGKQTNGLCSATGYYFPISKMSFYYLKHRIGLWHMNNDYLVPTLKYYIIDETKIS